MHALWLYIYRPNENMQTVPRNSNETSFCFLLAVGARLVNCDAPWNLATRQFSILYDTDMLLAAHETV
jgi:hypothetical protein